MRSRIGSRAVLGCALVTCFVPDLARAAGPYHVTELGTIGSDTSLAYGINNYGQVVGYSGDSDFTSLGPRRAFLWTPTVHNGTVGSMMDLGDLPGSGSQSFARGINDYGQVTGATTYYDAMLHGHAFLWTPITPNSTVGLMTDIGDLPPDPPRESWGEAINRSGQVTGSGNGFAGSAMVWTPSVPNGWMSGSMAALGYPNSAGSAINTVGQVAGFGDSGYSAILWTPSGTGYSYVDLGDLPGGNGSNAIGLNDAGEVVGSSIFGPLVTHAFRWTPSVPNGTAGSMIDLGTGKAFAINALGEIVGNDGQHARLWVGNSSIDLNAALDASGANWVLASAYGINDRGQIVGSGMFDPDGGGPAPAVERAYLLTPIPEPFHAAFLCLAITLTTRGRRGKCHFAWRASRAAARTESRTASSD